MQFAIFRKVGRLMAFLLSCFLCLDKQHHRWMHFVANVKTHRRNLFRYSSLSEDNGSTTDKLIFNSSVIPYVHRKSSSNGLLPKPVVFKLVSSPQVLSQKSSTHVDVSTFPEYDAAAVLKIKFLLDVEFVTAYEEMDILLRRLLSIRPPGTVKSVLNKILLYMNSKPLQGILPSGQSRKTRNLLFCVYIHSLSMKDFRLIMPFIHGSLVKVYHINVPIEPYKLESGNVDSNAFASFPQNMLLTPTSWTAEQMELFFRRASLVSTDPLLYHLLLLFESCNIDAPISAYAFAAHQLSAGRHHSLLIDFYFKLKKNGQLSREFVSVFVNHFRKNHLLSCVHLVQDEILQRDMVMAAKNPACQLTFSLDDLVSVAVHFCLIYCTMKSCTSVLSVVQILRRFPDVDKVPSWALLEVQICKYLSLWKEPHQVRLLLSLVFPYRGMLIDRYFGLPTSHEAMGLMVHPIYNLGWFDFRSFMDSLPCNLFEKSKEFGGIYVEFLLRLPLPEAKVNFNYFSRLFSIPLTDMKAMERNTFADVEPPMDFFFPHIFLPDGRHDAEPRDILGSLATREMGDRGLFAGDKNYINCSYFDGSFWNLFLSVNAENPAVHACAHLLRIGHGLSPSLLFVLVKKVLMNSERGKSLVLRFFYTIHRIDAYTLLFEYRLFSIVVSLFAEDNGWYALVDYLNAISTYDENMFKNFKPRSCSLENLPFGFIYYNYLYDVINTTNNTSTFILPNSMSADSLVKFVPDSSENSSSADVCETMSKFFRERGFQTVGDVRYAFSSTEAIAEETSGVLPLEVSSLLSKLLHVPYILRKLREIAKIHLERCNREL